MKTIKMGALTTIIACGLVCQNVNACIVSGDPLFCDHEDAGWSPEPAHTRVQCDFGGGVSVTFDVGVYDEEATIYAPQVAGEYAGLNGYKEGPVQKTEIKIYTVTDCVLTITTEYTFWVGCTGWVPDEDSGPCIEGQP